MTKVSIIGGTGYGGAEILRHLLVHPEAEVIRVSAADHIGEAVGDVHHSLYGRTDLVFEQCTPQEAAEGADVAGWPASQPLRAMPTRSPALKGSRRAMNRLLGHLLGRARRECAECARGTDPEGGREEAHRGRRSR